MLGRSDMDLYPKVSDVPCCYLDLFQFILSLQFVEKQESDWKLDVGS